MTGNAGVYHPHMVVPKGTVEVYVGGGQPAFYAGSVMGTVEITEERRLTRSYACAH